MKLYLVETYYGLSNVAEFEGIFSTEDKAIAFMESLRRSNLEMTEVTLDKPFQAGEA